MSTVEPPVAESQMNQIVESQTTSTKSADPKQFRAKQEPQISYNSTGETGNDTDNNDTDNKPDIDEPNTHKQSDVSSVDDEIPPTTQMEAQKSELQIKMEERASELMREKQKIKELQQDAFERQVAEQQGQNYKRLYDVWQEFATNDDASKMDINGLTKALAVFGMIIDTNRHLQKHIFKKFDLDNQNEITYDDFSATIASFVGSNTDDDSLQTLFEIFDMNEDGYLELEEMARILLAQNQITVVVTGKQQQSQNTFTKNQCLKQAKKMVTQYDSDQFNDNKIS